MIMIEINGRAFRGGDVVHFEYATLPENRWRDYEVRAISPGGLEVAADGFSYSLTTADADRLGMTLIRKHHTTEAS
ncbi:hypothetical protein [Streptomyces sp. NPDC057702]|uniref:hypothetical protein n=1 Tax=Streptomyces sp. NPDC057702 TaxID=3346221 RepID=UPI0036A1DAC7